MNRIERAAAIRHKIEQAAIIVVFTAIVGVCLCTSACDGYDKMIQDAGTALAISAQSLRP